MGYESSPGGWLSGLGRTPELRSPLHWKLAKAGQQTRSGGKVAENWGSRATNHIRPRTFEPVASFGHLGFSQRFSTDLISVQADGRSSE